MPNEEKSIPEVLTELKDLTVTYARQETVEPLKGIARFVAFGIGGSFILGIGVVILTLAGLRALQTETGTMFTGNLSWLPYLFATTMLLILTGLSVWAITRESKASKHARKEDRR